jgi:hypothetical protein
MENPFLFKPQNLPPKIRYEKLFSNLLTFPEDFPGRGRPPFTKDSLLRGLIYRNLRGLPSLSELAFELKNNPVMAEVLGFPAWESPPSIERFSHYLRSTPNEELQVIRLFLPRSLLRKRSSREKPFPWIPVPSKPMFEKIISKPQSRQGSIKTTDL